LKLKYPYQHECLYCGWYELEEVEEAQMQICTKCFRWQEEPDEDVEQQMQIWSSEGEILNETGERN
jgi:hypothetical protein